MTEIGLQGIAEQARHSGYTELRRQACPGDRVLLAIDGDCGAQWEREDRTFLLAFL